jgi:hypothetical protein
MAFKKKKKKNLFTIINYNNELYQLVMKHDVHIMTL